MSAPFINGNPVKVLYESTTERLSFDPARKRYAVDDVIFPNRTVSYYDTLADAEWELFTRIRRTLDKRLNS